MDAPYELGESETASNDLKLLRDRAIERGMKHVFLKALKVIVQKLRVEPATWGDPEYRLKKEGGGVFHAGCNPLFVRYAVFEPEKKVMLLSVTPMPMSGLE